ncbi:MAG: LamG-like jellyroll fold domain-containing protein [Pyrinomonadaceae bacterium]
MYRCICQWVAVSAIVILAAISAAAQTLKADYRFQSSRSSEVAGAPDLADLVDPAHACPSYCNGFSTDTVDGASRSVLTFPVNNGLALQPTTSVVTNPGVYSIAVLFKMDNTSGYRRLIDFLGGTADTGVYVNGGLAFYPVTNTGSIPPGTWTQVVITRDASNVVTGYINGTSAWSFTDSSNLGVIDGHNTLRFFQDNTSGGAAGEASSGSVARIRIWDGVLSSGQVAALDRAASVPVPAPAGLTSWYPADGNSLDVRSRNDGTPQNGVAYAAGEVGQAFSFDGIDDSVDLGTWFTMNDFTISMWVKPGETQVQYADIIDNNHTGAQNWVLQQDSTNTNVYAFSGTPDFTLTPNVWQHVVVTHDASNAVSVYVNGAVVAAGTFAIPYNGTQFLRLGRWGGGGRNWNGQMDEVAIFSRALTAADITALYGSGQAGMCKPTATVPPTGLVGWWGGDGDARDISGNANDGILRNGAGFASGKVGQGFRFDGIDDSIDTSGSPNPSLNFGAGDLTIEAWVNFTTLPLAGSNGVIYADGYASNGAFAGLRITDTGNAEFSIRDTGFHTIDVIGTRVLNDGAWHHIVGTRQGTTGNVYVDGTSDATPITNASLASINTNCNFGFIGGFRSDAFCSSPANESFFNGLIDEVSVYNRALTQAEFTSIYNAGLAGKLKTATTVTGFAAPQALSRSARSRVAAVTPSGPQSVGVSVGDATVSYPSVTTAGLTQEIPIDGTQLPRPPFSNPIGLFYDIATTAVFSGSPTVCFHVPAVSAPSAFNMLRIKHFESGTWVDRTDLNSINSGTQTICTTGLTSLSPFAIVTNVPTAAKVSVGGRVLTNSGAGLRGATVMMTGPDGKTRTAVSNAFGYYTFSNVQSGEVYTLVVGARRFTFGPKILNLTDAVSDLNFTALY